MSGVGGSRWSSSVWSIVQQRSSAAAVGLMNTDAVVTRIRREYDELRRL